MRAPVFPTVFCIVSPEIQVELLLAGPTPLSSIELLGQSRPCRELNISQSVLARRPTWQDVLTATATAELLTEETLRVTEEDILTCSVLSARQDPFPVVALNHQENCPATLLGNYYWAAAGCIAAASQTDRQYYGSEGSQSAGGLG